MCFHSWRVFLLRNWNILPDPLVRTLEGLCWTCPILHKDVPSLYASQTHIYLPLKLTCTKQNIKNNETSRWKGLQRYKWHPLHLWSLLSTLYICVKSANILDITLTNLSLWWVSVWSSSVDPFWSQFCACWQCEEILRRLSTCFKCSVNWNMLNTKSMGCEMFAITGTVVIMKAALIYTLSLIWFIHGTSASTSQALSEKNRLVIAAYCHHSERSNDPTSSV